METEMELIGILINRMNRNSIMVVYYEFIIQGGW